jgi:olfactory receptor
MQPLFFGLFLSMYVVILIGNLLIILVICTESHLHTLIYFFLCNLSFVNICFITTTVSKVLVNIQAENKDISYIGCLSHV